MNTEFDPDKAGPRSKRVLQENNRLEFDGSKAGPHPNPTGNGPRGLTRAQIALRDARAKRDAKK